MHLPLFFDVVCTQVHCLPTNHNDNVVTTLLEYCCQILIPSVVRVSVPFSELHEHAYLYCSCFGTKLHCLPTNYGNRVVRFLIFYYCTKYCLYQSFRYRKCIFPFFFVVAREGHCLPTNYQNNGVKSLTSTSVQRFVHVSIQVTGTYMSYSNVWAEVVFCGFPKNKMFTYNYFTMPIVCASSKSVI